MNTMPTEFVNRKLGLLWRLPILFLFAGGGILQYLGALSQTESNWIALILFLHVFMIRAAWNQLRYEIPLFIFIMFVVLHRFEYATPASYTLTYLYYLTCAIIAAVAGRMFAMRIASSDGISSLMKFAKIFLSIQLFFVVIQSVFTEQFIALSGAKIGYVDAIFGTLFLQSDAALAAVCELLIICAFLFSSKVADRFIISATSLLIIFLGNSNASKIAVLLICALLLIGGAYRSLSAKGRHGFNILAFATVTPILIILYSLTSSWIVEFFVQAADGYYRREAWETASRFSPIGQIFTEGVNMFGYGALTYYNPITKEWLYNAGFSTIYSLYLDFGLVGILLYLYYQLFLMVRFTYNYIQFFAFFCVLAFFMVFNFALTDLAFVFAFNAVLYLNYLEGRPSSEVQGSQFEVI